jgi:glycosyltransferase involved in cell wall biosynthesis
VKAVRKPLHVRIVSIYFHPDMSGTGQVLTDLAVGLKAMGCDVSAYTTHPAFGSRERSRRIETYRGVEIHRVFRPNLSESVTWGRAVNALTFFVSVLWTLLVRRNDGPLLIVSHPPFMVLGGYVLARLKGQSYVYVIHDVFPDAGVALGFIGPRGLVRRVWDWLNRLCLRKAASVIVLSQSMKDLVLEKYGDADAAGRLHIIHNWVDEGFIRPVAKADNWFVEQHGLRDKFVVLYSGSMGLSDDLETVIAGAERFRDRNAVFLFVGDGSKRKPIQELAERKGLANVRFLPYQPAETLPFSLACSDVSLVALRKGIEGIAMPSKLYAIMASGRPVVALVERGLDVAQIVESAGCGKSVEPGDVEGFVNALESYYRDRALCDRDGQRGREYLEAHFARSRALREYYDVLQNSG